MQDSQALAGSVAVVTGSGRGIGRAIALELAAAGATAVVVARSGGEVAETLRLIDETGGRAFSAVMDLCDIASVKRLMSDVQRELGPVDLLVNNAGSHRSVGNPWQVDPETWWEDIETNLKPAFLCSRFALAAMVERGAGRIINVASGAGLEPRAQSTAYASAKAAVIRLTESLDAATREHGIKAFSIHPGGVKTGLTDRIMESAAGQQAYPQWREYPWQGAEVAARLCREIAAGAWDFMAGRYIDATWPDLEAIKAAGAVGLVGDAYRMRLVPRG